jgi:hypothetical protein
MLGLLLLLPGLAALGFGVVSFFSVKRMAVAPFRTPGELALSSGAILPADAPIATEGRIVADNAIRAPCSGQTCLYYEITLDREWERPIVTGSGKKKETGTTRVTTSRGGAIFQLDDGSGPVNIDARDEVQADLARTHLERFAIGQMVPGEIQFGQMRVQTPVDLGNDRTTAFTATERVLLPQGVLYACGRLVNGAIGKPPGGPLVLSQNGRLALLAAARQKAMTLLVVGALFTAGSIPAFLLQR